jgi:DNA-binding MarR family transcriptional regulator
MSNWLTLDQQQAWRAWLSASRLLTDRLNRDLQDQQGLTSADYEILVWLSEAPERRLRMSELAERTLSSRSRLSHQIDRMEQAGLVARFVCTEDRRGSFAALTDTGWATLVAAAPDHVASVRSHLVDALTPEELRTLGAACQKISDRLQESQTFPGQPQD